ncbi:hypothetical protein [Turicibacter bilis]|uniref:hypothetical protein n=1 Tax=Turicibacter bilis TaxID=2735723 RepID=UPI0031BBAB07
MTELLLEAKTYSEETEHPLSRDKVQQFEQQYQKIIEEGYLANPLKTHEKIKILFHYSIAYPNDKKKY